MVLKSQNFSHGEEKLNKAFNVDDETIIVCRERILFCHMANALQCIDLYGDPDNAPKEFTTVTGDLQRTLSMITDPLEYEMTLIHFMSFHKMAVEAVSHWKIENDSDLTAEDKVKLEILKMLKKFRDIRDKEEEEEAGKTDVHSDIKSDEALVNRVNHVKASKYNFVKYMDLLGYKLKHHSKVDDLLRDLFTDSSDDNK